MGRDEDRYRPQRDRWGEARTRRDEEKQDRERWGQGQTRTGTDQDRDPTCNRREERVRGAVGSRGAGAVRGGQEGC